MSVSEGVDESVGVSVSDKSIFLAEFLYTELASVNLDQSLVSTQRDLRGLLTYAAAY